MSDKDKKKKFPNLEPIRIPKEYIFNFDIFKGQIPKKKRK